MRVARFGHGPSAKATYVTKGAGAGSGACVAEHLARHAKPRLASTPECSVETLRDDSLKWPRVIGKSGAKVGWSCGSAVIAIH